MTTLGELSRLVGQAEPVPRPRHDADATSFGEETPQATAALRRGLRRLIVAGSVVVFGLVLGLLIWAAIATISGAVIAAGTVRVENNSKQIRHLEAGIIRQILVREGQRVRRGQVLVRFDDVQPDAAVRVFQSAVDGARAQAARFQAEAQGAGDIAFPPELMRRQYDPQVALLIAGQRSLFATRMMLYRNQAEVLRGQAGQMDTQIAGMRAQVASADSQSDLIGEELSGVRELNQQGYAPRSRMLALQRSAAGLKGQRGSLLSDIARTQQAIGQARIELAQLEDKRQTEAAEGLRAAQAQLTETEPKLGAMRSSLEQANVLSPVDGFVFGLTQFTEGGVAGAGEALMEIVPADAQLIITTRVKPNDITDVRVGMHARVTLTAYNPRTTPQIEGRVILVSADATTDPNTREPYYAVQVRVPPEELARAGRGVRLTPGMPAQVAIVTGSRTILDYLLGPMTEAVRTSLREK